VEEFGKAILLRHKIDCAAPGRNINIDLSANHQEKFEAGFSELIELQDTSFARVLRVTSNANLDDTVIEDPLQPGVTATVPASSTGLFSDGLGNNDEVDPTVALRFALLYVDFQPGIGLGPARPIGKVASLHRWEVRRDDLLQAIKVLWRRVENRTT
jgi:hypothetical protein